MTNWEKFMEVFGIPVDSKINTEKQLCAIINCKEINNCSKCPLYNFYWEREYKENNKGVEHD